MGEALFLRTQSLSGPGVAYLVLEQHGQRQLIAGPIAVQTGEPTSVPAKIVPDAADIAAGLTVQTWWLREQADAVRLARIVSGTAQAPNATVHVDVQP